MTASRLNQTFCPKGPEWLIVTNDQALGKEIKSTNQKKKNPVCLSTPDGGGVRHRLVRGLRTCHWQIWGYSHYTTTHNAPATTNLSSANSAHKIKLPWKQTLNGTIRLQFHVQLLMSFWKRVHPDIKTTIQTRGFVCVHAEATCARLFIKDDKPDE